jgi:acetylornithine deacetylase/succinyl-diaminopimelate desuccinylase-like protein
VRPCSARTTAQCHRSEPNGNSFIHSDVAEGVERMHGVNERIGVGEYERAIRTYRQIIIDTSREQQGR